MTQYRNAYSREDILQAAEGQLFDAGRALLPCPPFLMFDRIVHIDGDGGSHGKGEILAELDVRPDLWFFACHFKGDPIMPGTLGIEALLQLVGFYLAWTGHMGKARALGLKEAQFRGEILPGAKTVSYRLDFTRTRTKPITMAIADGTVSVDGHDIYYVKGLQVGLFPNSAKG